ncbi:hypothetical protein GCM10022631_23310 [Deinococcus rubellus]
MTYRALAETHYRRQIADAQLAGIQSAQQPQSGGVGHHLQQGAGIVHATLIRQSGAGSLHCFRMHTGYLAQVI